jgi:O-antigen/teichoic acid export membrane protein
LSSAFPLGAIQLIGNIYSWIDSILLSVLRSSTDLGYYSVAFNVVNVLGAVPSFLMTALVPSLVNADTAEITRLVNRAVYVLFCLGAPLAVGGIVLRKDIILVLAGQRFLPASAPFAILAVTLPVSFLQTAFGYTSVAIDRYRPLLAVGLGTLVLNVVANLLLIPPFGPTGAASALLGSEIVSLVATYFVFRRMSGIRITWTALWRPVLAALVVLGLLAARGPVWSHMNHLVALLVGGSLVAVVYVLGLLVLGGVPVEIPRPTLLGKHQDPRDG